MMNRLCVAVISFCSVAFHSNLYGSSLFFGYEFGQMAFNEFQNFAGEIGYSLDNNASVRLSFLNVALSERHLSSSEARAVDGDNVEGLWRGAEVLYDHPLTDHIFISPSAGHFDSKYSHTILDASIQKKSTTIGMALSYKDRNLFGLSNLYIRFSVFYRYYLDPIERTMLGDSVVTGGSSEITPAILIGYQFD